MTTSTPASSSTGGPTSWQTLEFGPIPSLTQIIGGQALIRIAVLAALAIAVFWRPLESSVIYRWRTDGNWSHGWLVPLFSLYFLHINRQALAAAVRRTSYVGLGVVVFCLLAYFATYTIYPRTYARPLCFVGTIAGLTLFLGGWQVMRVAWFPIAFLMLSIPLPNNIYIDITMRLRQFASVAAATLLSLIPDVHADVSGVVIDYSFRGSRGALNVEQACSGMRLMMAFVTLGIAMAYLGPRPAWQRIVMVLSCLPIAVLCNTIRVTITGMLYVFKDQPIGQAWHLESLTRGSLHSLLGLSMLPIALGLFALVGWILSNLFIEEPSAEAEET